MNFKWGRFTNIRHEDQYERLLIALAFNGHVPLLPRNEIQRRKDFCVYWSDMNRKSDFLALTPYRRALIVAASTSQNPSRELIIGAYLNAAKYAMALTTSGVPDDSSMSLCVYQAILHLLRRAFADLPDVSIDEISTFLCSLYLLFSNSREYIEPTTSLLNRLAQVSKPLDGMEKYSDCNSDVPRYAFGDISDILQDLYSKKDEWKLDYNLKGINFPMLSAYTESNASGYLWSIVQRYRQKDGIEIACKALQNKVIMREAAFDALSVYWFLYVANNQGDEGAIWAFRTALKEVSCGVDEYDDEFLSTILALLVRIFTKALTGTLDDSYTQKTLLFWF